MPIKDVSDTGSNIHKLAIQSLLFKGRSDLYFCFLKSERIAHVLIVLSQNVPVVHANNVRTVVERAEALPERIVQHAIGEEMLESVLAEVLSLAALVRLQSTRGSIHQDNARVIVCEYEGLLRRLTASTHVSPFVSMGDFAVPEIPPEAMSLSARLPVIDSPAAATKKEVVKDVYKGQSDALSPKQQSRLDQILQIVREKKQVSIKDISAIIRDCSEKTIQRELGVLIEQGLVRRVGERRWSLYTPA